MKDWWTPEDRAKSKAATAQLVAQYDAYCPFPAADGNPAQCEKGALTRGDRDKDAANRRSPTRTARPSSWYAAFRPRPGEALFLAPDARVKI